MICRSCKIKTAHIVIIDEYGEYDENNVLCCWCFAKDYKERLLKMVGLPLDDKVNRS